MYLLIELEIFAKTVPYVTNFVPYVTADLVTWVCYRAKKLKEIFHWWFKIFKTIHFGNLRNFIANHPVADTNAKIVT